MNYTNISPIIAALGLIIASTSLVLASQQKPSPLYEYVQTKYGKQAPQKAQQGKAAQQQPTQDPAEGSELYKYIQAKYCKQTPGAPAKK